MATRAICATLTAIAALTGCATVPAETSLPSGTRIEMHSSHMGERRGNIVLEADNRIMVDKSNDDLRNPVLSRYRGTIDAVTADRVRTALAPFFLDRVREPDCGEAYHDAPSFDVKAFVGEQEIGDAGVYLGCQGRGYSEHASVITAQYAALKDAAQLEAEPYETIPGR